MSKESLPTRIDPFRFADNGISLEGVLPVKSMPRLSSMLQTDEGELKLTLVFGLDEEKIRYVKGHADTELMLQCQRCMNPFKHQMSIDVLSAIVTNEKEASELPDRYDPLIVIDQMLTLSDIIEDELIVCLPVVPMHNSEDCRVKLPITAASEAEFDKQTPFKVIEFLRSKRDA